MTPRARRGGARLMLLGGEAFADPAPRLVELRQLVARADRPGQGGLAGAALPAGPRRRARNSSRSPKSPRRSATHELQLRTASPLSTGITMHVARAGPADAPPVILLHGFPESHRTWRDRRALARRPPAPDHARPARLRGKRPAADVEAYATDKLIADMFALADACGIEQFTWSVMTGAARSPGPRRCAATRGSSGWRSSTRPTRGFSRKR